MRDDLEQAHDREILDVGQQVRALSGQPIAAEPEDLRPRLPDPQLADQLPCVEVARGLATGEKNAHGGAPVYGCPLGAPAVPITVSFPGHRAARARRQGLDSAGLYARDLSSKPGMSIALVKAAKDP